MKDTKAPVRSAAAALLDALRRRGVNHVFANAGTDFAPVIEAMADAERRGHPIPEFHTIPHENVAVSMAHGYYLVTGEPVAAMVHVTVGTANALCGLMNAARDNVPLLLMAGHTPNTETGHAGSRNAGIHWGQDSFDQGGMVREYVKWDYEMRAGQSADEIIGRALDIAMSEPRGPVYLSMPREVLGDPEPPTAAPHRLTPGATPAEPSAAAIEQAASWTAAAEFPLILAATLGRDPANVVRLAQLADQHGIAVGYPGEPGPREVSIPSNHPMFLGLHPRDAIARADVIVSIDCEIPWWPRYVTPRAEAKLIHIAPDPLFGRYPLRGIAIDLAISGNTSVALRMFAESLARHAASHQPQVAARRALIAGLAQEQQRRQQQAMVAAGSTKPILPAWIAACVNEVKRPDTIIVNELGVPMAMLDLREPRTYISSSLAGGLGFGLGAALGARLGAPSRDVILIVGDGSYMFGNPVATHFVARSESLPTLTLVLNNSAWHAVRRSTLAMYPSGVAAQAETMPLVALSPAPEYERVMQACGGHGERVAEPSDLVAALRRGLDAVHRGVPALLNIVTGTGDH